ncbi:MAG: glycerol-3-phosphate dehydrogenase/oxidase [Planctomycetaceae bacterium]
MSTSTSHPADGGSPVLILGGGVNGACVARELVLAGVPVVVVDEADLGGGATAKSSRLIHGGLRYLEYADIGLVRESLAERARLLKLAPHLVRPMRLHIPIARRLGGLLQGGLRFVGLSRVAGVRQLINRWPIASSRGLWAVRFGLWMYDRIAARDGLPGHSVLVLGEPDSLPVNRSRYRWECTYWDAQMLAPERFVVEVLRDACQAAGARGVPLWVLPYHRAVLTKDGVRVAPVASERHSSSAPDGGETFEFTPSAIVNATGPWGDFALRGLPIEAPRLCGGTKGSHLLTQHAGLRAAIGDDAIYAEADDGRLVFILPWGDSVMVGTTDERFEGRPEEAIASEEELAYLIAMANQVFPQVELSRDEITLHYSGVRPLPYVPSGKTGAITRDHQIDVRRTPHGTPVYTLIGGKLTTCRALGALAAGRVLEQLGLPVVSHTEDRPLPGGVSYPASAAALRQRQSRLAESTDLPLPTIEQLWSLLGVELEPLLQAAGDRRNGASSLERLPGTDWPVAIIDHIIQHEWVTCLDDLIERRLMLLYDGPLTPETIAALADRLRAIHPTAVADVSATIARLRQHYGVTVADGV